MANKVGTIKLRGNPVTLVGSKVQVGGPAPLFTAVGNDLKPVSLSDYKGKVVVLATVPSLDTPVCDMETRRFNSEAVKLGDAVAILTVSMDLPFAQARWCGAAGVDRLTTLSDHRQAEVGLGYGILIEELRLLARAVFVIDREGILRYQEVVGEVANEPDYPAALEAVRKCL